MLSGLIDRPMQLAFRQMLAVIGGAHPASIALHRSAGFADTGYKHVGWLDTILMQKALGDGNTSDPDLLAYPAPLSGG